jgi:hypothetical protein
MGVFGGGARLSCVQRLDQGSQHKDGEVQRGPLRRAHMSREDLDEDLREKGVASPADVAATRVERSGKLSVIEK